MISNVIIQSNRIFWPLFCKIRQHDEKSSQGQRRNVMVTTMGFVFFVNKIMIEPFSIIAASIVQENAPSSNQNLLKINCLPIFWCLVMSGFVYISQTRKHLRSNLFCSMSRWVFRGFQNSRFSSLLANFYANHVWISFRNSAPKIFAFICTSTQKIRRHTFLFGRLLDAKNAVRTGKGERLLEWESPHPRENKNCDKSWVFF